MDVARRTCREDDIQIAFIERVRVHAGRPDIGPKDVLDYMDAEINGRLDRSNPRNGHLIQLPELS